MPETTYKTHMMSRYDLAVHGIGDVFFVARRRASDLMRLWQRRVVTRAHLRDLEPSQLPDIGLSEKERERECRKWCWEP